MNDTQGKNVEVEPCDLCEEMVFRQVAIEAGYHIYRCRYCGLVQVRPLPEETKTKNTEYWHVDLQNSATCVSRHGSQSVFRDGLLRLERVMGCSVRGKSLLDVGCGMGLFLEIAKEMGAKPHGIDMTIEAVKMTRELCGIDTVVQGEFETSRIGEGSYDVITGWGILHHTRHPGQWLAKAHSLLADGGLLLVKMPNVTFTSLGSKASSLLRLLRLPVPSYLASKPPLNLYGFTCKTLKKLIEKAGFDVLEVGKAPIGENRGMQGRIAAMISAVVSVVSMGHVNVHPVIMAIARKR